MYFTFLVLGNTQPVIEGQLKEKKGKWRLFRRWRTRYFTLSGAHLSCRGSVRCSYTMHFYLGRMYKFLSVFMVFLL